MTKTDLIKMENGKKELPIGISAGKGRNKGYRLNRTVRQKEYNFGSFQNIEHALRTNGYIDIIVEDLKEAHAKEGVISIEEIRELIAESSTKISLEMNELIDTLYGYSILRENTLEREIRELHVKLDAMTVEKEPFRMRLFGR